MIGALVNRFIYRPDLTAVPEDYTPALLSLQFEDVTFTAADGTRLTGWYAFGRKPRHALLYCHGNAGNRRDWINAAPDLVAQGCGVFVFDYRWVKCFLADPLGLITEQEEVAGDRPAESMNTR